MTQLSCLRAGILLERRASGLSDADRLRLEEHLSACKRCARDSQVLTGLVELSAEVSSPLSERARDRVIARALREAGRPEPEPASLERAARWRPLGLAGAALAAAVIALVVWPRSPEPSAPQLTGTLGEQAQALVRTGVILGGTLVADGATLGAGHAPPSCALLSTDAGAALLLAHATVELAPNTAAAWHPAPSTVRLERGRVEVIVDATAGQRFAVATERFEAVAMGTHFEVTMTEVRVLHGRVRVLALPSRQVVAELDAGESWQAEPAAELAAADADARERPLPVRLSGTGAALRPEALLARARSLLARGQVDDAWSVASAALARQLSPALEAEARSLLAECALVKGHNAEAARRYGEVARRFPDSPAGESALFAAARAELDAGRRAAARALLRKYLHRYPNGRFRAEAEARLSALDRKDRGQSP